VDEVNAKAATLKEELASLQQYHTDARFLGGGIQRRRDVDKLDVDMNVLTNRLHHYRKLSNENLRCILQVRTGLENTLEKLQIVKVEMPLKEYKEEQEDLDLELLQLLEMKSTKMMELLGLDPSELNAKELEENAIEAFLYANGSESLRVASVRYGDLEEPGADEFDWEEGDGDAVLITRKGLKSQRQRTPKKERRLPLSR